MDARATLVDRIAAIRSRIADAARRAGRDPATVTLVAVTKSVSQDVAAVAAALSPDLGENRPQELWRKAAVVPSARWHLIGHLQRNKLDRTVPLVTLIHSVDSERLLEALDACGRMSRTQIAILLELNCSREAAKGGFSVDDVPVLSDKVASLPGIAVRGLMTMAAYSEDPEQSRSAFAELRRQRDDLQMRTGLKLPELSMGMSGDFEIAVEEGATLVRIGTSLFEGLDER